MHNGCPFCVLVEDGSSPCWRRLFSDGTSGELLWSGERFVVVLDTAPIVAGHVLIVPIRHASSLGVVGATKDEEFAAAKRWVAAALGAVYEPPTFFEHGATRHTRSAGACVDHAHLHAVPGWFALMPALRRDFSSSTWFEDQAAALTYFGTRPYLYCEEPSGLAYGTVAMACTTQYLRRLVAMAAGVGERWNWRDCIDFAPRYRTAEQVRTAGSRIRIAMAGA